jgi:hypothetical protein
MGHMIFRSPTAYSAISNISRRNGENELPLTFVAFPLPIRSYMTYLPKQLLSRRISWRPRRSIADQQTVSLKSVLPLDHPEPWINGPAVHLPKGLFQTLEANVCPSRRAGTRRRGGERCKQHIYLTRKSPIITDSYRRRSSLATMSKARKTYRRELSLYLLVQISWRCCTSFIVRIRLDTPTSGKEYNKHFL